MKFFEKWFKTIDVDDLEFHGFKEIHWVKENPYLEKEKQVMAKFKVGDKVRISKHAQSNENTHFAPSMKDYKGDVVTIAKSFGKDPVRYEIKEDFGSWVWDESWLEPAGFTKADLKDGMVVEAKDGRRRLVIGKKFMGQSTWTEFNNYTDDLKNRINSDFDIEKVYKSSGNKFDTVFKDHFLTLIWEREEAYKEMTVAEIEEKLGYKIKVVADKE